MYVYTIRCCCHVTASNNLSLSKLMIAQLLALFADYAENNNINLCTADEI